MISVKDLIVNEIDIPTEISVFRKLYSEGRMDMMDLKLYELEDLLHCSEDGLFWRLV